jgi:hypothetical protein
MGERQYGREADMLGAHYDGSGSYRLVMKCCELLQRTGCQHASWPIAGYESCRSRSFAHAGGE